jgi:hypothetical protein
MKKKIYVICVISMFLLMGITTVSVIGKKVKISEQTDILNLNDPPNIPICGGSGTVYLPDPQANYFAKGVDPNGDRIKIFIAYNDGTGVVDDSGWVDSGYTFDEYHRFPETAGTTYEVDFWVKDEHGAESQHKYISVKVGKGFNRVLSFQFDLLLKLPIIEKLIALI